jgi:hypothetical protein
LKLPGSCDEFTTKRIEGENGVNLIDPDLLDLLLLYDKLEDRIDSASLELINPEFQPDLVRFLQGLDLQIQELIVKIHETYISFDNEIEAIAFLENSEFETAKKILAELYYTNEDYQLSRNAHDALEYISLNKPEFYYANLDEKASDELNSLYFKEINELLIQVKEDTRLENEMLSWELYALELIKESGLPVAQEAEKYLSLNEELVEHHHISPIPLNIYQFGSVSNGFEYSLGLIPNPAMTTSQALINIPEGTSSANLSLMDSYNNQGVLQSYPLNVGDNIISLDVSAYTSGLYTVVVEVDQIIVVSAHLVVIH